MYYFPGIVFYYFPFSFLCGRIHQYDSYDLHLIASPINWLGNTWTARIVIVLALLWRWTGYNMIFFLAALQNIDSSIYEAAVVDGANAFQKFTKITIPMLRPTILLTAIMSTNGTLQLFDESMNITNGGPANTSMTISHYIYNLSFAMKSKLWICICNFLCSIYPGGNPCLYSDESR